MQKSNFVVRFAACAATLFAAGAAVAGQAPTGLWIDHTGRGAVEITQCGKNLCGHVAWVKDAEHMSTCGMQILGDVKPVGGGKWDGGWIYDPDRDSKFDVELTPVGTEKLSVMGYAGMKFLSETMTWKRAPDSLKNSKDASETTAAAKSPEKKKVATSVSETKKAAPVGSTDKKVADLNDDVDSADAADDADAKESAVADDDMDAQDRADAKDADTDAQPEKKSNKKTAILSKLGKFVDIRETRGGKRECHLNVPFLQANVTFPCPKK